MFGARPVLGWLERPRGVTNGALRARGPLRGAVLWCLPAPLRRLRHRPGRQSGPQAGAQCAPRRTTSWTCSLGHTSWPKARTGFLPRHRYRGGPRRAHRRRNAPSPAPAPEATRAVNASLFHFPPIGRAIYAYRLAYGKCPIRLKPLSKPASCPAASVGRPALANDGSRVPGRCFRRPRHRLRASSAAVLGFRRQDSGGT